MDESLMKETQRKTERPRSKVGKKKKVVDRYVVG